MRRYPIGPWAWWGMGVMCLSLSILIGWDGGNRWSAMLLMWAIASIATAIIKAVEASNG